MIPILFFYFIGLILIILSLETKDDIKGLVYLVISIFSSYIGYLLSFQDADYVFSSYFPMGMLVVSIILMIFRIWGYFNPLEDAEEDKDNTKGEIEF